LAKRLPIYAINLKPQTVMKQGEHQAVFLNAQGVAALHHLDPDWLEGRTLRCRRITTQGAFVEVVARARAVPDDENADTHLLIPVHFIDLIVLDEIN